MSGEVIFLFVIATLLGVEVINKVPPILHTPLMSGCNAISGVSVIGAIAAVQTDYPAFARICGMIAIAFASINVVCGFLVTDRMLAMFGKKKTSGAKTPGKNS